MLKRIDIIREKLQELKVRDAKYMVFGSKAHKYITYSVNETDILKFENDYGIRLPEEFREFLLEIGYGAGPNYGVYSVDKIRQELLDNSEILSKEIKLNSNFKFSNKDAEAYIELKKNGVQGYYYKILSGMEGWMPICHHGCSYYSILVVSGEQTGKVWSLSQDGYQILPEGVLNELTFYDWYEKWLDEQLSTEFQEYDIYKLIDYNPQKVRNIIGPKLETLPLKKILKCKNLESLSLTYNNLSELPRVSKLSCLPQVISKSATKGIEELKNLKMLFLSNNKFTDLPQEISFLENLVSLDISNNQISEILLDTPLPKALKSLKLNGNKLVEIPNGLSLLTDLERLDIQENSILQIPEDFTFPKSLKSINLSNNRLSSLPGIMKELDNLTCIDISYNKLEKAPEVISKLGALRALLLTGNKLEYLTGVQYLVSVMKITLNHCDLKDFPEELLHLKNLRMLEIANNGIQKLHENMRNMEGLIWLNLNQNVFSDFEKTIDILSTMPSLRDLSISYTTLDELPENISKLCFLDYLWLQPISDKVTCRRSLNRQEIEEQDARLYRLFPNTNINID